MLGGDSTTIPKSKIEKYAWHVYLAQGEWICYGIAGVSRRIRRKLGSIYLSGSGEFLIRKIWQDEPFEKLLPKANLVSFNERLGPERSKAACAWALTQMMDDSNS
jgi:uncharacterized hydantoinase/oxoprolinase family protein